MGTLKLDIQKGWRQGLMVVLIFGLTMFVSYCSSSRPEPITPEPAHPTHWAVGGPGWRVMDVQETVDSAGLARIHEAAEEVAECLGRDIDLEGWRIFGFNVLMYQKVYVEGYWKWVEAHGVVKDTEKWIYVQAENSRRSQDSVMGTLKHELVHVGMLQDSTASPYHPEVDPMVGKCAGMHKGQRHYKRAYERSLE